MKPRLFSELILAGTVLFSLGCSSNNSNPSSPSSPSTTNYSFKTFFGSAGAVTMDYPTEVGISGGTLWLDSLNSSQLQAWTLDGSPAMVVTTYGAGATYLSNMIGLNVGDDGYVYVANQVQNVIVEFSPTGQYVTVFGAAQLSGIPTGVAVNANYAYAVVASTPATIYYYSVSGTGSSKTFTYQGSFGNSASVTLGQGNNGGLRLDPAGNVYFPDSHNGRVIQYSPTGAYQASVSTGLNRPTDEVFDAAGNMFVVDLANADIQVFNPSGQPVTQFGNNYLTAPLGLAMDAAQNLYVSDIPTNQVVVFQKN